MTFLLDVKVKKLKFKNKIRNKQFFIKYDNLSFSSDDAKPKNFFLLTT